MSDSEELDLDGGEAPEASAPPPKKGGLGGVLPAILKFVAIGLGALIFIVTVAVITVTIMNRGGKAQTITADPTSPYVGKRPIYAYYTNIGSITVNTRDTTGARYSVTVVMNIGYDPEDQVTSSELSSRQVELRDFVRTYFQGKYAADLGPEKDAQIRREIQTILNDRFLDTAKVRSIMFDKFDVMEIY
ncbi:MAG: flagellar basal body-associated FliL family protein [Treponema sp.]|jgi:flagellar FliL protein|nr:flagellar basal body-associated FliL family protein [Treponema sp.]